MPLWDKNGCGGLIDTGQEHFTSAWPLKRAERAALDSGPAVRFLSSVVHPAHWSLPRMKLSFSVQATLISGNATQLHLEHKSLNTPLITHNTTVHHTHWKSIGTHHDGSWDVYPGSKGHKHLWFWSREHRLWMKPAGWPLLVSHSLHFQKVQGLERLCFELCGELCVTVSRAYLLI